MKNIDLSEFCTHGGCGAKLDPAMLSSVLEFVPKLDDNNLLVGFDNADDGAVYKLNDDIAMVKTLDFFTPIVSDPYTFGQIAATNALSDVYAMGGEPKICLNIVSFPRTLSPDMLVQILKGGADKVLEAGCVLCGGHSIDDTSVKYGLSVTGICHPDKIYKNNNCKIDDDIILTKPLGVGIIMAANQIGDCETKYLDGAIKNMTTLNKYSADIIKKFDVNSVTDVTGFGLLGHLNEMIKEDYSIVINSSDIKFLDGAKKYAENFYYTAAGQRNRNHLKNKVKFNNLPLYMEELLFDPQTSGGLLISINKNYSNSLLNELLKNNINSSIIGSVVKRENSNIIVD